MKKAYLKILTWKGIIMVGFAEHYYGTLKFGDKRIEVCGELTVTEAKRFNKAEPGAIRKYRAGDESSRFTNRKKVIQEAIKLFKKDSHGYEILIEGESYVCNPQKILVGPSKIKAEANRLYNQYVGHGGEFNCETKKIFKKWDSLVGTVWENE